MPSITYGKNPVKELIAAGLQINKLFVVKGRKSKSDLKLIERAKSLKIPIHEVDRFKLSEIAGSENHQGFVAELPEYKYSEIDDIFRKAERHNEHVLVAILDEIQDPHNLGAIIRSAEAFGFHGLIIPKDRSAGPNSTVAKTSAGAMAHVPIVRVTNLVRIMKDLQNQGVWFVGTDQNAEQSVYEAKLNMPLGVVIGNEGRGIRRLVKKTCDFLVRIPLFGHVNSLNASVAAAIVFSEARNQRSNV